MRTFVIGDIHGALKALKQVLQRAEFNYKEDKLICLGDVCDGYPDVAECFDELFKVNNLVYILGNHDKWCLDWMNGGEIDYTWYFQGGKWTLESFGKFIDNKEKYREFLDGAKLYYEQGDNFFVHGGFNPSLPIEENTEDDFLWDRSLFTHGRDNEFVRVFVGHTTIKEVTTRGNVTNIDTGAGHGGRLTMLCIDDEKTYVSDKTKNLYPDHQPRG